MLAQLKYQMGSRGLVKVENATAQQSEIRTRQLRQVKGERDLSLKPWLDGVAIGGRQHQQG